MSKSSERKLTYTIYGLLYVIGLLAAVFSQANLFIVLMQVVTGVGMAIFIWKDQKSE